MTLHFLDFDYSEDAEGTATWDTVACVPATRLRELEREVITVLAWAHAEFGELRGPIESGGAWDYDLQCERAGQPLLVLSYAPQSQQLIPLLRPSPDERVTLTLSLSAGLAFSTAFEARFEPG